MKQYKTMLLSGLLCATLLGGCASTTAPSGGGGTTTTSPTTSGGTTATIIPTASVDTSGLFTPEQDDYAIDWQSQSYTTIALENGDATITNSGVYVLSGTLQDGSVTVNVDKTADSGTVYVVLNGVNINSNTGTPIVVQEAKKAVLLLADGTTNVVTQGAITTDDTEFPSAAIYSKADTVITGEGILKVTTQYNDGITSKDDLIITDGNIEINAVGDGLVGKDLLAIEQANIAINAGKDGLRSTNTTDADRGNVVINSGTITVLANNDGIQAEKVLLISGGDFDITTGGGYSGSIKTAETGGRFGMGTAATTTTTTEESMKGIKAGTEIVVKGGNFTLSTYEDAVHSNGNVAIEQGEFTLQAGDDGVHGDGNVSIIGGTVNIQNSYEGIEGANITISGGNVQATSTDDGFNVSQAGGSLTISGGTVSITAGGDGIDSNGNLTITGGEIIIDQSAIGAGDSALDYDGALTFTGGTVTDQNGTTIDPTVRTGPGGGKGAGGAGQRPNRQQ